MAEQGQLEVLIQALDLTDAELCQILNVSALDLIGGKLDKHPVLEVLAALVREAQLKVNAGALRRWFRASGPHGRPLDHLLEGDYALFEDAIEDLMARGFILSS